MNDSATIDQRIAALDPGLFAAIYSQSSEADKQSLLAAQHAVRTAFGDFSYLEIGSHLGGSLQPYVADPRCRRIYSIDKRPEAVPDNRGIAIPYPENSTARMLENLGPLAPGSLDRIVCFDADAQRVPAAAISEAPHLCFIDGEHTDTAVWNDFQFCLQVARPDAVITFHDAALVALGLHRIERDLATRGIRFEGLKLQGEVYAIGLGRTAALQNPVLRGRASSGATFLRKRRGVALIKRIIPGPLRAPLQPLRKLVGI
jgi:hypothetical protein